MARGKANEKGDASGRRSSARTRKPPSRLDSGGDDAAVYMALRKSLLDVKRQEVPVPEAPTFYPTIEELRDPMAYINRIAEDGKAAGIVRIVTPPEWRPKFNLECDKKFETKRQALHTLHEHQAFDEGSLYTLKEYQEMANSFSDAWSEQHPGLVRQMEALAGLPNARECIAALLETHYWRMVERASIEGAIVEYGSDINTAKYASGFAEMTEQRSWDLRHLATLPGSLLSKLGVPLEGLTQPWLYFGMLFATFCWHTEDHFLYSINYHHTGAPKTWYGIPAQGARRFELLLHDCAPDRFKEDPDLVHQLVAMMSPGFVMSKNIPVVHALQSPGDIIVTFPRAYHAGFSHGWNCAEACNFALLDWLPMGRMAIERYSKGPGRRHAVFSHDKLMWDWVQELIVNVQTVPTPKTPNNATAIRNAIMAIATGPAKGPTQEDPPVTDDNHTTVPKQERQGSGQSASTTHHQDGDASHGERPGSSAASRDGGDGGVRVPFAEFCARVLELPAAQLKQLPSKIVLDTTTSTPILLALGLSGTPTATTTLADVYMEVLKAVDSELATRRLFRSRGVPCTHVPTLLNAAGEDTTSCTACGAIPFFSTVQCACEGRLVRCWRHADLLACSCSPAQHEVQYSVGDVELAMAVYKLWNLMPAQRRLFHLENNRADGKPETKPTRRTEGRSRAPQGASKRKRASSPAKKAPPSTDPTAQPHETTPMDTSPPPNAAPAAHDGGAPATSDGTPSQPPSQPPSHSDTSAGMWGEDAEAAAAALSDMASSPHTLMLPAAPQQQRAKRVSRGKFHPCTACGRSLGTSAPMVCTACEMQYHAHCVPVGHRKELAPGVWLCEHCINRQQKGGR